jgi:hypothetical protein
MSNERDSPATALAADRSEVAALIMDDFVRETGVTSTVPPRRYLWTDAFAVCNCLTLRARTGESRWLELALLLVDQVHRVLGQHRAEDPRMGWLSGLDEEEAVRRPTAGGLRIGKPLSDRPAGEDEGVWSEWDRDGQYYHYLTRWMHALARVSAATDELRYLRWAVELALAAQRAFVARDAAGRLRMFWKMSVDLSRPLVDTMGQHDPLDGLITLAALQAAAAHHRSRGRSAAETLERDLDRPLQELAELCAGRSWATDDPLGIGGLLVHAHQAARLERATPAIAPGLSEVLLRDASLGLRSLAGTLMLPASLRLPFRELGLAAGIGGLEKLVESREAPPRAQALSRYLPLRGMIESTWLDPTARGARTWSEHLDINRVMLATSLLPDEYLSVEVGPGAT